MWALWGNHCLYSLWEFCDSTIIIAMTTKGLIAGEGMSLRSTRRLAALPPVLPPCPLQPSSSLELQSDSIIRQIDAQDHPKIEKESTSAQPPTLSPVCLPCRPNTRSHACQIAKGTIELIKNNDFPRVQQDNSSKKEEKTPAINQKEQLSCNNPSLLLQPIQPILQPLQKKPVTKLSAVETPSLFGEFRKSYRKHFRGQILTFPFRKCHDPLEGRIITVLNKLASEKQCRKELEGLADRLPKATVRQIRNRFVVAGLRMVIRMAKEKEKEAVIEGRLISRLQAEEKALQERIQEEITSFAYYEQINISESHSPDPFAPLYCSLVMKKIYSTLKRAYPNHSKADIRKRVISECQGFFAGKVSMGEMLCFVKKRLEG